MSMTKHKENFNSIMYMLRDQSIELIKTRPGVFDILYEDPAFSDADYHFIGMLLDLQDLTCRFVYEHD